MQKIILLSLSLLFFNFTYSQSTIRDSIQHDNLSRDYILYVPEVYDASTSVALVINIHGYGSNMDQQMLYGNFRPFADVDNFLVVHPNGTLDPTNSQFFNAFGAPNGPDDVGFISALIDSISAEYNIDTSKVYATGMSNGGFMSYVLACELSDKIHKIASVTGTMYTGLPNTCSPIKGIPVMQIHGTSDATVAYNGSANFTPVEDVVDYWVAQNNCDTTAVYTSLPDVSTSDNCSAERFEYLNGDDNSEVIFYKITDGGHTWPGALFNLPGVNTNHDFSASEVIWEFFKGAEFVGISDRNIIDDFSIKQNTSSIIVNSASNNEVISLSIFNALGQQFATSKNNAIHIEALSTGVYFLLIETNEGYISKTFLK